MAIASSNICNLSGDYTLSPSSTSALFTCETDAKQWTVSYSVSVSSSSSSNSMTLRIGYGAGCEEGEPTQFFSSLTQSLLPPGASSHQINAQVTTPLVEEEGKIQKLDAVCLMITCSSSSPEPEPESCAFSLTAELRPDKGGVAVATYAGVSAAIIIGGIGFLALLWCLISALRKRKQRLNSPSPSETLSLRESGEGGRREEGEREGEAGRWTHELVGGGGGGGEEDRPLSSAELNKRIYGVSLAEEELRLPAPLPRLEEENEGEEGKEGKGKKEEEAGGEAGGGGEGGAEGGKRSWMEVERQEVEAGRSEGAGGDVELTRWNERDRTSGEEKKKKKEKEEREEEGEGVDELKEIVVVERGERGDGGREVSERARNSPTASAADTDIGGHSREEEEEEEGEGGGSTGGGGQEATRTARRRGKGKKRRRRRTRGSSVTGEAEDF